MIYKAVIVVRLQGSWGLQNLTSNNLFTTLCVLCKK